MRDVGTIMLLAGPLVIAGTGIAAFIRTRLPAVHVLVALGIVGLPVLVTSVEYGQDDTGLFVTALYIFLTIPVVIGYTVFCWLSTR